MTLTDKTLVAFEKWYLEEFFFGIERAYIDFSELPMKAMQIGVYQLFFDFVGIDLFVEKHCDFDGVYINLYDWTVQTTEDMKTGFGGYEKSREQAWTEAITKADELYNEQNK